MGSFTPGVSVSESYYSLLSVEPHATPDEIRKAYRKLALRFHPDKNPDAGETFQKISTAYATLSDPQRRQVYDRFGEQGVQIMEQAAAYGVPPWLLNPAAQSGLLCVLLVVVVGLVVVFPVILTMRIDGGLAWPWPAVFTPFWLVDLLVLALAAASPRDRDAGCWRCVPNRRQVNLALLLAFQLLLAYKLDAGEQARSDHPRPPTALPHTHTHTLAPATRLASALAAAAPAGALLLLRGVPPARDLNLPRRGRGALHARTDCTRTRQRRMPHACSRRRLPARRRPVERVCRRRARRRGGRPGGSPAEAGLRRGTLLAAALLPRCASSGSTDFLFSRLA